jgi:replicative DNA helicase
MIQQEVKLPPFNTDAEEALIGSLVIDGEVMRQVYRYLKPSDFYHDNNRAYYQACCNLYERREAINQVTIASEMKRQGSLEKSGGTAKLYHFEAVCPTSCDAEYYADLIKRSSVSRQIVSTGDRIAAIGYEDKPDTNVAMEVVNKEVEKLRKVAVTSKKLLTPVDAADAIWSMLNRETSRGIMSGFYDLDQATTGFYPGELTVFGARPSIGKTQLMLDIAENMAEKGKRILFVSEEMSIDQLMERKVARCLHISIRELRSRQLTMEEMDKATKLMKDVAVSTIDYLAEDSKLNDIQREIEMLLENDGLDIVFVDYLQRIPDCWTERNMDIGVGKVSAALKSLAKEYELPLLVPAQLNRGSEIREDKRPSMSELRYSGNIEQDADNIMMGYRSPDSPQYLELKQEKGRQVGTYPAIKLMFNTNTWRYVNATG